MDETKKLNIATPNNNSYSTMMEDTRAKNSLENTFLLYNNDQSQNHSNSTFKNIPGSLPNNSDADENNLVNKILNSYGYKPKMLALILSSFFCNYINSFTIYNVSTNVLMLQSLFASYSDNVESFLSIIAYVSKIIGCLTVSFFAQKMLRSTIVFISISFILAVSLLLVFHLSFYTYIIFLVIGGYFTGLLEPISMDNLCETLPIRFRGYFLFFLQSGFSFFQIIGFLILSANSKEEDKDKFNTRGIYGTHFIIIFSMGVFIFFFFKNSPRNLLVKERYAEAFEVLAYFKVNNDSSTQNTNFSSNENQNDANFINQNRLNNSASSNYNAINNNSFSRQETNKLDNIPVNNNNNNYEPNNLPVQNYTNCLSPQEQEIIIIQSKSGLNSKLKISFTEIFSKYFLQTTIIMSCIVILSNVLDDGITAAFAVYIETLSENKSSYAVNMESFKISIFNLIGYLVTGLLLEIKLMGRKINLRINLILSAVFYLLFTLNAKNFQIWLPLVCISITSLNAIVLLFVSELYPSKIRDASQGYFVSIVNLGGLLGQSLFLLLVKKSFNYPFIVSICFIILFFVLLLFIKHETNDKALDVLCDFDAEDNQNQGNINEGDSVRNSVNLRMENQYN